MLGSWLGSTWFQFRTSTKTKALRRKGCEKCLAPGLDPLARSPTFTRSLHQAYKVYECCQYPIAGMWPGCVNSKCASKRASRPAAEARAHATQTPQGAHIRHTLLTSVVNSLLQDNGLAARSVTMRRNVHTPAGSRPKFHKECTSGAQGLQML